MPYESIDEKIENSQILNKNKKLNEEMIKLRNLGNLDLKQKIILELNIDKLGLDNVIWNKNSNNKVINIIE